MLRRKPFACRVQGPHVISDAVDGLERRGDRLLESCHALAEAAFVSVNPIEQGFAGNSYSKGEVLCHLVVKPPGNAQALDILHLDKRTRLCLDPLLARNPRKDVLPNEYRSRHLSIEVQPR